MTQEQTVRRMLDDPQFAHMRPQFLAELQRIERRKVAIAVRQEELAVLPFKIRVRLHDKDWAGTWHAWNVEALTGAPDAKHPQGTWELIGGTYDSGPGRWDASYYPDGDPEGKGVSVASGWTAAATKHEAVIAIAAEHARRHKEPRS
jgi:hypothetical protein